MGLRDFFRKRKAVDPADEAPTEDLDRLPDLQPAEPGSLADVAMRAHGTRAPSFQPSISPVENEGLPSVNRRRGGNQLVNALGILAIVGVGIALIVAVNGKKKDEQPKRRQAAVPEAVANTLPPLTLPAPPPLPRDDGPPASGHRQPGTRVPAIETAARPIPVHPYSQNPGAAGPRPIEWTDRKMAGSLVVGAKAGTATPSPHGIPGGGAALSGFVDPRGIQPRQPAALPSMAGQADGLDEAQSPTKRNELAPRLDATETRAAAASLLRNRNFLITKGTNLDCALEEAIVTSLPGIVTCRLSQDVYSDNGQVLLMERGTQLVGEQQGNVRRGHARVFALFSRAKTPNGVVINLDSPGTDALGRSGLGGWVDHHFAERFGAAILISLIQDTMKAVIAREQSRGGTTVYGGTADSGAQVVEKILESSVNIPPTVIKNHGDHIQVKVARDLDFSTVYALQAR